MEDLVETVYLPEAIFIVDTTGTIINCNKAAEDIFGWSMESMMGTVFFDFLLPGVHREQFKNALHAFKGESKSGFSANGVELDVLHQDGYEFPVEINICSIDKQCSCSFIITARDLSERKHRVQVLRQVSQSQHTINSILKIALGDYSLEEILLHSLEAVLRLKTPKLLPKGAVLLVEEDAGHLALKAHKGFSDQQIVACSKVPFGTCHCGRAAQTGEIQFSDCVDNQHDIKLDNMEAHGHYCVPIRSGDNVLGVMSLYLQEGHAQNDDEKEVLRAVTNILAGVVERQKVEIQRYLLIKRQKAMITRIFDEKKLNESIIQSLNAGLVVFDFSGNIVTLNQSGREILSQFMEVGASHPDSIERFADIPIVKHMQSVPLTGEEKTDEASQVNTKGEEKTLQYTIVPWENSSGRQIGFILLFKDITETLRIQREMENMNRLSTVAEIASAVAHEVRNPLAGIKTMSQAIEENCDDDDENKEYITRIIRQVDRLNDLLTEFFTYARPGEAKKEKVSIGVIVNEIRQLLKVKLDSKRLELEETYADGLPDIYVDPDQMHQVFLNLMLNAIDATNNNGKIEIRANLVTRGKINNHADHFPDLKEDVDYVAVSFRDNGKGMSPEVARNAFEPFYTTKSHGSGLGLAIVQRILTENNAFIVADSSQFKGMVFEMMFESVH